MSNLLNKRLARSLWRTKTRLIAVVLMVFVGVFAGITFGGYAHNLGGMYDTIQADDDRGANLADIWIYNRIISNLIQVDIVQFLYYNTIYEAYDQVVENISRYQRISIHYINLCANSINCGYKFGFVLA